MTSLYQKARRSITKFFSAESSSVSRMTEERKSESQNSENSKNSISTSLNPEIKHNYCDFPGITIDGLTGDICKDVSSLFEKQYHETFPPKYKFTYTFAIAVDPNFNESKPVTTISSTFNEKFHTIATQDDIKKFKLMNEKNIWKATNPSIKGAQLIDRNWISLNETNTNNNNSNNSKNKNKNKNKTTKTTNANVNERAFTVMQFNMLADGLSGGYLDSKDKTRIVYKIDEETWFHKCEKCFLKVNPLCLQWRYRGLRLIEEILRYETDIIALEECDQVDWMYEIYLKNYGYKMIFVEKQDSPCPSVSENFLNSKNKVEFTAEHEKFKKVIKDPKLRETWKLRSDGCAIFYKSDKFELLSKVEEFDYNKKLSNTHAKNGFSSLKCSQIIDLIDPTQKDYPKLEAIDKKKSKKSGKTVLLRPATTFIALHLLHKSTNKDFIIVTSHLKSTKDAEGEKLRVGQLEAMFGHGPYRSNENNGKIERNPIISNPSNIPILFCCDLNAQPTPTEKFDKEKQKLVKKYDCEAYNFLTGKTNSSCNNNDNYNDNSNDSGNASTCDENDSKTNNNGLGFCSLMKMTLGSNKEPDFTTWKERRIEEPDSKNDKSQIHGEISKHTIDYIFKKDLNNDLKVTHYLDIPDINQSEDKDKIYENKALLPDWHYPSDHFSLAMRFEWNE